MPGRGIGHKLIVYKKQLLVHEKESNKTSGFCRVKCSYAEQIEIERSTYEN